MPEIRFGFLSNQESVSEPSDEEKRQIEIEKARQREKQIEGKRGQDKADVHNMQDILDDEEQLKELERRLRQENPSADPDKDEQIIRDYLDQPPDQPS